MHRTLIAFLLILTFASPAFAQSITPTPVSDPLTTSSTSLTQEQRVAVIAQLQQLVIQLTQQLQTLLAARTGQGSGSTSGAAACNLTRTLALGAKGEDVTCLQRFLIAQNYLSSDSATGYFGPLTEAAVQRFQSARSIVSSGTPASTGFGLVGRLTRAAIAAARPQETGTGIGMAGNSGNPASTPTPIPGDGGGSTTPPPPVGGTGSSGGSGGSTGGGSSGGGGSADGGTTSTDTTAPTVAITAPAANSTVSGTVTITAPASDNVGVVGVQFKLDNANLGAEDTTSPYSMSWNTASTTNGAHTLAAVVRDAAGNRATSTVGVVVNNVVATTPTISVLYPARFVPGTPVTIGGTGFDATRNVIHISGPIEQNFVGPGLQNGTLFTFTFPLTAPTGAYTLTVNNGTKTSAPFAFTAVDTFTPPANPSAASGQSFLTISPNPCILDAAGRCTVTIRWETPASKTTLWVSKDGAAPVLVGCLGKNGTSTPSWITGGHVFEFSVYAVSSCTGLPTNPAGLEWLASISTAGIPAGALQFPAPNIGMEHFQLSLEYLGHQGIGFQGTDAEIAVQTARARKAMDDAKMLTGANHMVAGIPGFWPQDLVLWLHNPAAYWAVMDTMMHDARARGLAVIPYFNTHTELFSALAGDTIGDFFGNPNSASYQLFIRYVREFITRYKNDPQASIYFYNVGGESNNRVDLDGRGRCTIGGWICATGGNVSSNQLIAFQTRVASYIRTLDPTKAVTSGNATIRSSALHLKNRPEWVTGTPDWTLDTKAEAKSLLTYMSQGLDLIENHFYNPPRPGGTRDNERFCPGPDCISGANNAGLLDMYKEVADSMGKKVYLKEYGDYDPYLKDFLPNYGPFVQSILNKTIELGIPYSAPWSFEFYASRTSTYSQSASYQNIEPGYTDSLLAELRAKNAALGSATTPPLIEIPLVEIVLMNPLDNSTLTGTSTLLYAVASAPRVGAAIKDVKFYVDDALVSTQTTPPYQFTLPHSSLKAGTHKVKATATDTMGHSASWPEVSVSCVATICTKK